MRPRPEIAECFDRGSDHDLTRLGAFPLLGAMMGGGLTAREVPTEFWHRRDGDDGFSTATVDCPCGAHPVVELAAYPSKCEGCERWFFYAGKIVFALAGPRPGQATDATTPDKPGTA